MKKITNILASPISYLINHYFSSRIYPDSLKFVNLTPIFKNGDKKYASNYRPISGLPLLSKIFEKAIAARILNFSTKNSIFSKNQFGFQQKKSTCEAITILVEHIYSSFNDKKDSIGLFIDFKKAFDTVNHKILVDKLRVYGIRGLPLQLLESYLSNRFQCVRVGSESSSHCLINVGVPQGSVLGPILFLYYINDLPNVSELMNTILFADDTTLYASSVDSGALVEELNVELHKIYKWTCSNRLSLNVSKTYAILFSKRSNRNDLLNLKFNDEVINYESTGKFLGVTLDSNLSFRSHINIVCNKLSKTIGVLHRIQFNVPSQILINLYYSLFYPYLLYCNLIWGGTYQTHLKPLKILQKKVVRIITKQHFLAHTNDLFFQTKILKFDDIHKMLLCQYVFKNRASLPSRNHNYLTRNSDNVLPRFQRLTITQHSIFFAAPIAWNSIPSYLKDIDEFGSFKKELKKFLVDQYV